MSGNKLILIGGGSRSGKSTLALSLARRLGRRRLFLASAQAGDEEMTERIARHQATRGDGFTTVEEPLSVAAVIRQAKEFDVCVFDCLTLWLSNHLVEGATPDAILSEVDNLVALLQARTMHAIIVTNEVGLGIVPESALGRIFRDLAGVAHQRLSAAADEVYCGILGTMLRLKPAPVVAFEEPKLP